MNVTTYSYQIEGQGITTYGAFKISNPSSSKEVLYQVESKLKQLESQLKNRGLQFQVTRKVHISQAQPKEGNENLIPDLNHQNLTEHIEKIVAERFGQLPKNK